MDEWELRKVKDLLASAELQVSSALVTVLEMMLKAIERQQEEIRRLRYPDYQE